LGRIQKLRLTISYDEPDEDGWIVARVHGVPGAISQGRTREEARENVIEALRLMLGRTRPTRTSTVASRSNSSCKAESRRFGPFRLVPAVSGKRLVYAGLRLSAVSNRETLRTVFATVSLAER
jgi:predicted RNase H-like HicB family nuclease